MSAHLRVAHGAGPATASARWATADRLQAADEAGQLTLPSLDDGEREHGAPVHPVLAWSKPAGRRRQRGAQAREPRRIERRYETGEQRECEPCAVAGRAKRGYTRNPGLVACLRCWQLHERAGLWATEQRPHDTDTCRLCRPSVEPDDDATTMAPMLGSLLPYNPVDRPLSASRPALANPWQAVELVQHLADDHAASGRRLVLGHDFGRVEVAVAEVYASLTIAFGPVVRPSVREVYTRVGCSERRAQYALRALQRAGVLYQHADGCVIRGDDGEPQRLAAEYELRIPLAHLDRSHLMEELDEVVDRDLLDAYLAAVEQDRNTWPPTTDTEISTPGSEPVDNHCTPSLGLLSLCESRSTETLTNQDHTKNLTKSEVAPESNPSHSLDRPRTRRGYALARKLQARVPRWQAVPLPILAAALEPLADLGWSAYRVDRATSTYGPVSSSSGLTRTLRAVIDFVTKEPVRRDQARVDAIAKRIAAARQAQRQAPAVWSDTSAAARNAYELAAQVRNRSGHDDRAAGWEALRALTADPGEPAVPAAAPAVPAAAVAAHRSALILARARQVAAAQRAARR